MSTPHRSDAATGRDPELTTDGTAAHDNPEAADRGATPLGGSGGAATVRCIAGAPAALPNSRGFPGV